MFTNGLISEVDWKKIEIKDMAAEIEKLTAALNDANDRLIRNSKTICDLRSDNNGLAADLLTVFNKYHEVMEPVEMGNVLYHATRSYCDTLYLIGTLDFDRGFYEAERDDIEQHGGIQ